MFKVETCKSEKYPYKVVDVYEPEENNFVADFIDRNRAISYSDSLNRTRKLSCCQRSVSSLGWHHDHNCKGVYEKPVIYNKIREYITSQGGVTRFAQVSQFEWECTHGGWTGEVISEDELTLKHAYGEATYESYEEFEKEGEWTNKILKS